MITNAQRVSEGVLYCVQFTRPLDDEEVARVGRYMLEMPLVQDLTLQEEYTALVEAMGGSVKLTEVLSILPLPLSEQEFRDFLRRLLERLDAMRPWPEWPFRCLNNSRWSTFATARPIARIGTRWGSFTVHKQLHRVMLTEGEKEVLILQLRSGDEVALVTPWWPGSKDIALLQSDPHRSPLVVVSEFLNATGFPSEAVTVLS